MFLHARIPIHIFHTNLWKYTYARVCIWKEERERTREKNRTNMNNCQKVYFSCLWNSSSYKMCVLAYTYHTHSHTYAYLHLCVCVYLWQGIKRKWLIDLCHSPVRKKLWEVHVFFSVGEWRNSSFLHPHRTCGPEWLLRGSKKLTAAAAASKWYQVTVTF